MIGGLFFDDRVIEVTEQPPIDVDGALTTLSSSVAGMRSASTIPATGARVVIGHEDGIARVYSTPGGEPSVWTLIQSITSALTSDIVVDMSYDGQWLVVEGDLYEWVSTSYVLRKTGGIANISGDGLIAVGITTSEITFYATVPGNAPTLLHTYSAANSTILCTDVNEDGSVVAVSAQNVIQIHTGDPNVGGSWGQSGLWNGSGVTWGLSVALSDAGDRVCWSSSTQVEVRKNTGTWNREILYSGSGAEGCAFNSDGTRLAIGRTTNIEFHTFVTSWNVEKILTVSNNPSPSGAFYISNDEVLVNNWLCYHTSQDVTYEY